MSFYTKILVPLDGSAHADKALQHAITLAQYSNASLVLVTCFEDIPMSIGGEARAAVIAECEKAGHTLLAPYCALCEEKKLPVKAFVRMGSPGAAIVQVCEQEGCDLIVMGSRGQSDFVGMMLGSVSHKVLRNALVPVMIVR